MGLDRWRKSPGVQRTCSDGPSNSPLRRRRRRNPRPPKSQRSLLHNDYSVIKPPLPQHLGRSIRKGGVFGGVVPSPSVLLQGRCMTVHKQWTRESLIPLTVSCPNPRVTRRCSTYVPCREQYRTYAVTETVRSEDHRPTPL